MEKFKTELNGFYYPGSRAAMRSSGMKDQLDWIKRQLEYASFSEKYCLRYDLKRGEIYEFDWGPTVRTTPR